MEKNTWQKNCYDGIVVLNVLFIIVWILLAIFPGFHYLFDNNIILGLQTIFLNYWCLMFAITLALGIWLHFLLPKETPKQST
ncbi:MAG: hypothetical protein LUQ65_05435 [Candidatus Helarchaeota archaeon]|nr:hypothetical protein [Candidatus Helarchaeota archaeon]